MIQVEIPRVGLDTNSAYLLLISCTFVHIRNSYDAELASVRRGYAMLSFGDHLGPKSFGFGPVDICHGRTVAARNGSGA